MTSLPSLTEEDIQRQQSYLEKNDEVFDEEVVPKQNESSILNINVETSIPLGNEVQEESQRGTKECVIPCSKPIITGKVLITIICTYMHPLRFAFFDTKEFCMGRTKGKSVLYFPSCTVKV